MQELKIVFPNAQRINRGGQVWKFLASDLTLDSCTHQEGHSTVSMKILFLSQVWEFVNQIDNVHNNILGDNGVCELWLD